MSTFAYNFGSLFKMLSSLWRANANFSFRHNIHRFVDVLHDWCIPRIYEIYQHFCFVPLTSRFNWKVQYLFCNFCFQKIFDGLRIVTWTWSHWCRSKFCFCNSLTSMLYLPCTKYYYWDIYCLRGIWICLYSCMLLLELMVLLLSIMKGTWG